MAHRVVEHLNDPTIKAAVRLLKSKGLSGNDVRYAMRWLDAHDRLWTAEEEKIDRENYVNNLLSEHGC